MTGALAACATMKKYVAPLPPVRGTIVWGGAQPFEAVAGAVGTTSGTFHCNGSGGGGGPYGFVLYWVGSHTRLAFTDATSGETHVDYSGLNVGDVAVGNTSAVVTDFSTGETYDIYANEGAASLAGVAVKRTS